MYINPKLIDHTNLNLEATEKDIEKLCQEAKEHGFGAVCIRPNYVAFAKKLLNGTPVRVCTVIGFHTGLNPTEEKVTEAKKAIKDGADELDMVINVERLKNKSFDYVKNDISSVRKAAIDKTLKVIIEAGKLSKEQKKIACELVKEAGADFVKTSTGFEKNEEGKKLGANIEDVKLIKKIVKDKLGIKAAGGINTPQFAQRLIAAGATRIGASSSIAIMSENLKPIEEIGYSWEWFKYHADQRLRAFYYYLVIVGALALGYLTLVQSSGQIPPDNRIISWLFLFSFIVSFAFLCLEIRNTELVNIGRIKLEQLGLEVSVNDACPEYIIALERTLRCKPILRFPFKHELWLRLIYILVALFSLYLFFDSEKFFVCLFWKSWVPLIILFLSIGLSLLLGRRTN